MRKNIHRKGQRLIQGNQLRQKLSLHLIYAYTLFGASFIAAIIFIASISESRKANATLPEIKHVKEQVFINDMSVEAPVISVQGKPGPDAILIQSIKKAPEHSANRNE
jgi:hypothetical protein